MIEKLVKYKHIFISLFIFIILIMILFISLFPKNTKNEFVYAEEIETKENDQNVTIKVDIKGSVKNPGVYQMKENDRVIDQTTPNMIQRISGVFERKPLILKEI